MSTVGSTIYRRIETHRIPALAIPRRRLSTNALLNRPDRRKDSGTSATNFRGRAKAKRVRLRKLQRQARRNQR